MKKSPHPHPFYGHVIDPDLEQKKINKLLKKFQYEEVSETLKKKIYNELSYAKTTGFISIPFKVVMRNDPSGVHKSYIEILLDTKV